MNNNNDNGEEMGICSRCGDCVEKNLMDQHINNTCSSYIFDMSSSPSSKISNFPKAKTFFQGSQSPNQIKKIKPNNSKVEFLPLSSKDEVVLRENGQKKFDHYAAIPGNEDIQEDYFIEPEIFEKMKSLWKKGKTSNSKL
ncbi:10247_t:CDS:2 [Entrophospora sp. SA101]|nr:10247_t:CDS:2 [Entrophospora sp. SA101]